MISATRCLAVLALALLAGAAPARAQDIAIKAGLAVSRFGTEGVTPYDGSFVGTSVGGHVRFMFGRIGLQPELHMVARGASINDSDVKERIRLEYIELPVMAVVPFSAGSFEPYLFAGPTIAAEARCRYIVEEDGLKTNFGCDDASGGVFDRRTLDWGVSGGAGVSHPLGGGRLLLEGRHTWGLRNIFAGDIDGVAIRNRSFQISIGYTVNTASVDDQ